MLEPAELRQFSQLSSLRTTLAIFSDWLLIAAIFAVFGLAWSTSWKLALAFYPLLALLMGRSQLALAILMHDGSHRRLFKSHAWNDWVGQLACAAPLFFAMDSYKRHHLKHHLNPLVEDDPDIALTGGYPISRASFYRKISRDLSGVSYFKFVGYFLYMSRRQYRASAESVSSIWIVSTILAAQAMILVPLWLVGHPWFYLSLWILPLMTTLQFLLRIRGITEHAGYEPNDNQALNARTLVNPFQTFFFAPHGVHYHIEHHLYPSVPHFRLKEVHAALKARGALPEKNLYTSYGAVIRELIR